MSSSHQQPSTDIFSLSDQVLSDQLQFVEEIGYGNWGSVWLCRPKARPHGSLEEDAVGTHDVKLAVKLVHRSKTPTTAARVRSLWNEMKIVRSFKQDPHPSIIPFHSFIITPSYALITMAYLPTLVPVEVQESIAKEWFRSLLSGVAFLHQRGVVHNDIKPANILLSSKSVPVLVDFGFAEKYEVASSKAFISNLAYGTPEYLSPERARGLQHDTRKSDVWSLGVTFFEILIGRTPFEYEEGESFASKEDLEKYWARTMRGKWVGAWKMSRGVEKMLRRMVAPNADLRCTASDAMADPYWGSTDSTKHRRSTSASPSLSMTFDSLSSGSKLMDVAAPWNARSAQAQAKNKAILISPGPPAGLESFKGKGKGKENKGVLQGGHLRAKSQPKVAFVNAKDGHPRGKRGVAPGLASVKGSPSFSLQKENATSTPAVDRQNPNNSNVSGVRRPFGPRVISPSTSNGKIVSYATPKENGKDGAPVKKDAQPNTTPPKAVPELEVSSTSVSKGSVKDRVKDWEKERERLRQMVGLDTDEGEGETDAEKEKEQENRKEEKKIPQNDVQAVQEQSREDKKFSTISSWTASDPVLATPGLRSPVVTEARVASASTEAFALPASPDESSYSIFKHGLKFSLGKTMHIVKTSTLGQLAGRMTPGLEASRPSKGPEDETRRSISERESWEDEALVQIANSSLPTCRHAVRTSRIADDNRADRLTIWMRNVEQVVAETRQVFEACKEEKALPPLPLPPVARTASANRSERSSRLPRRVLAANEIFTGDHSLEAQELTIMSAYRTATDTTLPPQDTLPVIPSELASRASEEPTTHRLVVRTPPRARRATVSTMSPELPKEQDVSTFDVDTGSPSRRKEKSKSQGNLGCPIIPLSRLELEIQSDTEQSPVASPRLSALVDRSIFIAPPRSGDDDNHLSPAYLSPDHSCDGTSRMIDDLAASPVHVEPYPARKMAHPPSPLDSPTKRRIEGVYDRFLMATTGVKRVGKGYANRHLNSPVQNNAAAFKASHGGRNMLLKLPSAGRRIMPPPVSSDDPRLDESGEFGLLTTPVSKEEGSLMRRALKVVTGKAGTRKLATVVVAE